MILLCGGEYGKAACGVNTACSVEDLVVEVCRRGAAHAAHTAASWRACLFILP